MISHSKSALTKAKSCPHCETKGYKSLGRQLLFVRKNSSASLQRDALGKGSITTSSIVLVLVSQGILSAGDLVFPIREINTGWRRKIQKMALSEVVCTQFAIWGDRISFHTGIHKAAHGTCSNNKFARIPHSLNLSLGDIDLFYSRYIADNISRYSI